MEKSCHSTADSSPSTVTTAASFDKGNPYLKHLGLNPLSHKISKPSHPGPNTTAAAHTLDHPAGNLHQPPVYTINKNDFREVVQKLTGSPACGRLSSPPPIHPPKPPSSRLQRIRPPPLPQLSLQQNRSSIPSNQIQIHAPPPSVSDTRTNVGATGGFNPIGRPMAPSSPLPPLPSVLAAAESPVSAYMRHLHCSSSGDSRPSLFSGFSPLATLPPTSPQFQLPLSPRPFGCLNSPRSPYPPLSPGLLFSPSSGQMGFPHILLSPTDRGGGGGGGGILGGGQQ